MRYQNVCLEAFACTLPEEIVTSTEIEARLAPAYQRIGLPEGRLELITGIATRRFWAPGTLPSDKSVVTAEKAIRIAGLDKRHVGALIHGSVCRDFLEPATASGVHFRLGLPSECMVYDVTNACLGLMDGVVQIANMIELGHIRAGIVVGTENSRPLVENTIRYLNETTSLTRVQAKRTVASLTIGSGSAAIVLVDRELSRTGNRLLGGVARIRSSACQLCVSGHDQSVGGDVQPLMWTDSDSLMRQGVHAAKEVLPRFLEAVGWGRDEIHRTFCHQIGPAHRRLLFEQLEMDTAIDFTTVGYLGNTGSVALPMTAALGIQRGCVKQGDHVALWGVGSGINVVALGLDWQTSLVDDPGFDETAPLCHAEAANDVDSTLGSFK
jgi:acyl-CoA:acyl-CoA alkyltransferase